MPLKYDPQPGLGRALKQLREAKGLSQREVATAADIHPVVVSRIEAGGTNPTWGSVRGFARALGVTVAQIATLADELDP